MASDSTPSCAYRPRYWRIVFDLAGRDEDVLREQVERVLCGPEHPGSPDDCLIEALFMSPGADANADSPSIDEGDDGSTRSRS